MAKISLSYPDTWLTISISVKNRLTGVEDFSGTMIETAKVYKYDFTEVADTDYIYVATCTGYSDITGVVYYEATGWGGWWLTPTQDANLTKASKALTLPQFIALQNP